MSKHGKILVAMSGGIDSTVTAVMLAEEGYEVVGITEIDPICALQAAMDGFEVKKMSKALPEATSARNSSGTCESRSCVWSGITVW